MKPVKIFKTNALTFIILLSSISSICFADEAVLRKVLENGLTVLVKSSPPKDLVTINIAVKAAPVYEEEYLGSGISHFVEHMVFKGTKTRKTGDIEKEVRSYGGIINGSVSSDITSYQITLPAKNLYDGLALLKDMLLNASFEKVELEREREVLLKEIKLNNDDPEKKTILLLFANAYVQHPYKYPAIGFENRLKSLTREDLIKYYNRRYVPNNIVITVAGGISAKDAILDIDKEFSDFRLPEYGPINMGRQEPVQIGKRLIEEEAPITLSYSAFGFHSTGLLDRDLFAMDVLSMILARGNDSRLNKRLVKEERAAHSISASNFTPQDPGLFVILALLDKNKIYGAGKLIFEEINKIKEDGVTDKELETAKRMVLSDYILSRETIEAQSEDLCENEIIAGNYGFFKRYLEGVSRVSKSDIRRVALKYLNDDNLTEVRLVPKESGPLPDLSVPKTFIEEKIEKKDLPNGMVVLARQNTKIPALSITVALSGGLFVEDKNNNGISNFVARMLLNGTSKKKEPDIKGAVENRGGQISAFSGFNSFGLNITVLKEDLDLALDIIKDILTDSTFPQEEIDREKSFTIAMIKDEDDDIFQKGGLLLKKNLFEGYPYGMRYLGEPETVGSFKRDELMSFYRTYCVPNNTVISVSGDIEPEDIFKKVGILFKDAPRKEAPKEAGRKMPPEKIRSQTFKMDKEEALMMLGFKTVDIKNPDRYSLDVLNTVMSGMSGRLFATLRGKLALAYALGCVQKMGLDSGFMLFYVATTKEKLDTTRVMLFDEIKLIKEKPVPEEELNSAKMELINNYKMLMQTNSAYSFQSAIDELYGLGYDNLYKYEDMIKKVTKEDVKKAADKYLTLNVYTEIVIQPD